MNRGILRKFDMRRNKPSRYSRRGFWPLLLAELPLLLVVVTARAQGNTPMELTLSQAIDLALQQNRQIKLAQLAVVDSEHRKTITRSAYFPQIKNESTVLHITELEGVSFPAGAFGSPLATGPIPSKSLVIAQGGLTAYTSGTGLAQPLTQMFKIRESNRAATADINSAKIQVNQAEDEIALKVRQLYYGILIAQLREQAARGEVDASQVKLQESTDAVAQGKALEEAELDSRAAFLDAKQTVLTQSLQAQDLTLELDDLLGLPLTTQLRLIEDPAASAASIPLREECVRIAREQSPDIRAAQQAVEKAKAGLAAAKDAYIPDITGIARYSYQSGVPLLVHNFGTFGATFTYDLFDGGRRNAEIADSRTLLSEAELNLAKIEDEVAVEVQTNYNRVEQLQNLVGVAEEVLKARVEAARVTDRQLEQTAALPSAPVEAAAKVSSAKASLLEAKLGLSLAQGELKRAMGQVPR
jgi:outer membrane protein TolC